MRSVPRVDDIAFSSANHGLVNAEERAETAERTLADLQAQIRQTVEKLTWCDAAREIGAELAALLPSATETPDGR